MLRDTSQSEKAQYCMSPLSEALKIVKLIAAQSRVGLARGWGNGAVQTNGYRVLVTEG